MNNPIRMCIVCRERVSQKELIRLQCKDKTLISYTGFGRSFYICKNCIDSKKLYKSLSFKCKSKNLDEFRKKLKEILANA